MWREICGLGVSVAVTISWSLHHSLFWVVLHGGFGWGYVLYYWWTR